MNGLASGTTLVLTYAGRWHWWLLRLFSHPAQAAEQRERAGGPDRDTPYVTVYLAASLPEAHVIKGKLETEDIPVLLRYESGSTVFGLVGGALGSVEVQVPETLAERAWALVDEG